MNTSLFFYLCLSCFLNHELDAIRCREWRIFPGLSRIKDDVQGYRAFTAIHLPLFVGLLWACFGAEEAVQSSARTGLSIFGPIHCGLHIFFLKHPENGFTGVFSWIWIVGAALFGALHLWTLV